MNEVKELVEELRNKKSRDNRELLDRSADMIERLAKELCEKSGCHHKCHDTKDCVVEDDALLLINQDKSNNFDVKSNNELFKQALVEGLNRRFDREIEEAKKIEQIEEMAKVIFESSPLPEMWMSHARISAEVLYNEGWRKQSENVIELPCKVGTTLYFLYNSPYADKPDLTPRIYKTADWYFEIDKTGIVICTSDIHSFNKKYDYHLGETVFLTKEEAEAKMKGGVQV